MLDQQAQKDVKIRNVAIIAHVDHGKTTLVDAFLKQTHLFRDNQHEMQEEAILDFNELERERGITIKAKHAAVDYKGYKINIIDTPGHADFGGEVERTLNMADGCLLIVDAQEGPMPQTKFVLKKALETGLKPIVVINKIDKPHADSKQTLSEINDLFLQLVEDADQLDFPVLYAIGKEGKAYNEMPADFTQPGDISPLLEAIVDHVPAPKQDFASPFQMLITTLDFDPHMGRLLVGKVSRGRVKVKDNLAAIDGPEAGADIVRGQVKAIFIRHGLGYQEVESAGAGEIIAISGIDSKAIGGTLCDPRQIEALPKIKLSPPAVQAKFEANTSPFMGKEGKFVSAKQLQQRLEREKELNISLTITKADEGAGFLVAGRGELQLAILIEELRREGYEFQVRRPQVIMHEENGVLMEPLERLIIDVPAEFQGAVITTLGERGGELQNMDTSKGQNRLTYTILTRNLLGLRTDLLTLTKGNVVISNEIEKYVPVGEKVDLFRRGVLIASEGGTSAAYSLNTVQERGELFIGGSVEVYEGMIVGINKFEQDMEVNVTREREKSGVRRSSAEITQVALRPLKNLTLEFALVFLADDEILEVTPLNFRLRKQYLKKHERTWASRSNLTDFAKTQLGK
jgi:GTP-binding protein